MSKFKGVAYWSGSGLQDGWVALAIERLAPIASHGGNAKADPAGVLLEFPDGGLAIPVVSGQTQGAIPEGTAAGVLAVCLQALARNPGGIVLADDDSNLLPTGIRQTHPLYAADWERVRVVAETLELVPSRDFMQRHGAVLRGLI